MALDYQITTIEELEAEISKVYLVVDKGVIRLLCASVIANRMKLDPVWLLLVAPSSGGKSEFINALTGLKFVHPVSDITINTFASGMKTKPGEETSLLWKANYGILTFKDFTSIISKNKEAKKEVMSQLREIYDGDYVKRTGNGKDVTWKGKIGAIAGATEMIYESMADLSAMGDRFIMYSIAQPPRLDVARRVLDNTSDMLEKREHIRECFTSYLTYVLDKMGKENRMELSEETKEELLQVANFATLVRSAVITDFKSGIVDFVPEPEMPMRVTSQLYNLAAGFLAMKRARPDFVNMKEEDKYKLTKDYTDILYKVALDSIPKKRRIALKALAKYKDGVTTVGVAVSINYPTDTVRKWFAQLNGLGVCERIKLGSRDHWKLKPNFKKIMMKFDDIQEVEGSLDAEDEDSAPTDIDFDSPEALREMREHNKKVAEQEENQRSSLI